MLKLTLKQKESRNGWLYILPWLIGMLAFFLPALVTTVIYCVSEVDVTTGHTAFVGGANFYRAFQEDATYPQLLLENLLNNLKNVPLILIFSYFAALLLRKPFKGSALVKGIFFLTVILSSDVFLTMTAELDYLQTAQDSNVLENAGMLFSKLNGDSFTSYLAELGVNPSWIEYITGAVESVAAIFNQSGVQVFIFLAGLSAIPDSMYEAAHMEGATQWEAFWKITFPMTLSIIIVNFVYTLVDSFNSRMSSMIQYIDRIGFSGENYGYGSAMMVAYFGFFAVIMAAVLLLTRKRVFYYV